MVPGFFAFLTIYYSTEVRFGASWKVKIPGSFERGVLSGREEGGLVRVGLGYVKRREKQENPENWCEPETALAGGPGAAQSAARG